MFDLLGCDTAERHATTRSVLFYLILQIQFVKSAFEPKCRFDVQLRLTTASRFPLDNSPESRNLRFERCAGCWELNLQKGSIFTSICDYDVVVGNMYHITLEGG